VIEVAALRREEVPAPGCSLPASISGELGEGPLFSRPPTLLIE
jgi:hypothetical protein